MIITFKLCENQLLLLCFILPSEKRECVTGLVSVWCLQPFNFTGLLRKLQISVGDGSPLNTEFKPLTNIKTF